jgi:hypothetical protein
VNRRAFLTALSAIPAVALFPALLKAAPKPIQPRDRLLEMYRAMAFFGDRPDALFMSVKRVERLAQLFGFKLAYDEFENPWGGDICGTPAIDDDRIEVAAGLGKRKGTDPYNRSTLYLFDWERDGFIRHQAGHLAVSYSLRETVAEGKKRADEMFLQATERILRGGT